MTRNSDDCERSNETSSAVVSHGTIRFFGVWQKKEKKEKKKHVIRSYCTDGGQRLPTYKGANRAAWFLTNKISERLIII